jgi:hypothetical protein
MDLFDHVGYRARGVPISRHTFIDRLRTLCYFLYAIYASLPFSIIFVHKGAQNIHELCSIVNLIQLKVLSESCGKGHLAHPDHAAPPVISLVFLLIVSPYLKIDAVGEPNDVLVFLKEFISLLGVCKVVFAAQ